MRPCRDDRQIGLGGGSSGGEVKDQNAVKLAQSLDEFRKTLCRKSKCRLRCGGQAECWGGL